MSLLSWLRHKGYPEDLTLNPHQVCRGITKESSSVFADPPATLHRPDVISQPSFRPGGACQTESCDAPATFIVSRNLRGRTVCRGCMENMTAFGWTLEGKL